MSPPLPVIAPFMEPNSMHFKVAGLSLSTRGFDPKTLALFVSVHTPHSSSMSINCTYFHAQYLPFLDITLRTDGDQPFREIVDKTQRTLSVLFSHFKTSLLFAENFENDSYTAIKVLEVMFLSKKYIRINITFQ